MHSLDNNNKNFMQYALQKGAFEKKIFSDETVIERMLDIMLDGSKTNTILNSLLLMDITLWKNNYLMNLLSFFNDYVEQDFESNALLLSCNPMMNIALSAELLNKIGNAKKRFTNECKNIRDAILELGKMYNSKIESPSFYETLMNDEDFSGRRVIKIIT